jgi:hypothetical protein
MVLTLIALAVYSIPSGTRVQYDVDVAFNGYLPVMGGRTAKADVAMSVEVVGLSPSPTGALRASSDITTLKLTYNGAVMPFGASSVQEFYPKATIEYSPQGKLLKTDVPDRKILFRMPGLDPKRLQDITYLPIEFPPEGFEENKPFTFRKLFGDSEVEYKVTPGKIDGDKVTLNIKLSQSYTSFEDENRNESDEASAAGKVTTDVSGEGVALFDLKRGLIENLNIEATAKGHVINLKTQNSTDRQLKTILKVTLAAKA